MSIKVLVHGVAGRMGQEVLRAVCQDAELEVVGGVDARAQQEWLPLPQGSGTIPYASNLEVLLSRCQPQVLVDFSVAEASLAAARTATRRGINLVIGTTGLSQDELAEVERLVTSQGLGGVVAPNFALGAVMMIHLAKIAAPFFDAAEILEMHHQEKKDAPSGTALTTARAMLEARGKPFSHNRPQQVSLEGTRGGQSGGIAIHSLRLPGLMAHQEVVLGAAGQTLSLRHDTISRECYMPGVLLAIKHVAKRPGFIFGLDRLLGF